MRVETGAAACLSQLGHELQVSSGRGRPHTRLVVALLGFDDFAWADVFRPRLSTVAQPTYELGSTSANVLFKIMADPAAEVPRRTLLPGRLVIRDSCGAGTAKAADRKPGCPGGTSG